MTFGRISSSVHLDTTPPSKSPGTLWWAIVADLGKWDYKYLRHSHHHLFIAFVCRVRWRFCSLLCQTPSLYFAILPFSMSQTCLADPRHFIPVMCLTINVAGFISSDCFSSFSHWIFIPRCFRPSKFFIKHQPQSECFWIGLHYIQLENFSYDFQSVFIKLTSAYTSNCSLFCPKLVLCINFHKFFALLLIDAYKRTDLVFTVVVICCSVPGTL